jgi:SAM-dependent methyltransferase
MNKALCPVCGAVSEKVLSLYRSQYNPEDYKLYKCENCDTEWWEPLKMQGYLYEDGLFSGYEKLHSLPNLKLGSNHRAFFKNFSGPWSGRLLDVGCGNGKFLMVAKGYGFDVWGIDIDRQSVEIAKSVLGNNIHFMELGQFVKFARERNFEFDVITFFEVLEHQDRPIEFLESIKSILKKGGYVAGSVPNRDRWIIDETEWDYPPHHLLRFSKKSLETTLSVAGFSNIEVVSLDFSFKLKEWLSYIKERYVNISLIPGFIKTILSVPLGLVFIGDLIGRGPYLYFQARKI